MTRDEYIFKNATQIAERKIRVGRKLQAKQIVALLTSALTSMTARIEHSRGAIFDIKSLPR